MVITIAPPIGFEPMTSFLTEKRSRPDWATEEYNIEQVEIIEISSSDWKSDIISHYTTPASYYNVWYYRSLAPLIPYDNIAFHRADSMSSVLWHRMIMFPNIIFDLWFSRPTVMLDCFFFQH